VGDAVVTMTADDHVGIDAMAEFVLATLAS